jgi:hypothetical protein
MCWSRKGVPGSKRSREAGTPFLGPVAEPTFRSERAAACSLGGSLCTDPPNDPPQPCNPGGVRFISGHPTGHPRRIRRAPGTTARRSRTGRKSSLQHRWSSVPGGKALRCARDGVQPHPRWPACEATAYRRIPAPAPGATQLRPSSGRDARFGVENRSEPRDRPDEWFSSGAQAGDASAETTASSRNRERAPPAIRPIAPRYAKAAPRRSAWSESSVDSKFRQAAKLMTPSTNSARSV